MAVSRTAPGVDVLKAAVAQAEKDAAPLISAATAAKEVATGLAKAVITAKKEAQDKAQEFTQAEAVFNAADVAAKASGAPADIAKATAAQSDRDRIKLEKDAVDKKVVSASAQATLANDDANDKSQKADAAKKDIADKQQKLNDATKQQAERDKLTDMHNRLGPAWWGAAQQRLDRFEPVGKVDDPKEDSAFFALGGDEDLKGRGDAIYRKGPNSFEIKEGKASFYSSSRDARNYEDQKTCFNLHCGDAMDALMLQGAKKFTFGGYTNERGEPDPSKISKTELNAFLREAEKRSALGMAFDVDPMIKRWCLSEGRYGKEVLERLENIEMKRLGADARDVGNKLDDIHESIKGTPDVHTSVESDVAKRSVDEQVADHQANAGKWEKRLEQLEKANDHMGKYYTSLDELLTKFKKGDEDHAVSLDAMYQKYQAQAGIREDVKKDFEKQYSDVKGQLTNFGKELDALAVKTAMPDQLKAIQDMKAKNDADIKRLDDMATKAMPALRQRDQAAEAAMQQKVDDYKAKHLLKQ